jgi:hypothetical protein
MSTPPTQPRRPQPPQPWERGQAIVLLALVIVGVLGFGALAIDGGNLYTEQRRAQAAADNAVMAAAFADSRGVTATTDLRTAALINAAGNLYDNNQSTNWVVFNRPPTQGPYINDNEYLEVIITQTVPTALAHFVYRQTPLPLTVYAVAHGTDSEPLMAGYAIAAFTVICNNKQFTPRGNGGAIIKDGGVFVNATTGCDQSIYTAGNNARVATTTSALCPDTSIANDLPGGCIIDGSFPIGIGGFETGTHTVVCPRPPDIDWWTSAGDSNETDCNFYPAPQQVAQVLNPPAPQLSFTCGANQTVPGGAGVKTLVPGSYTTMNAGSNDELILLPGIYCITSKGPGDKIMTAGAITGHGVFIYIQDPDAKFTFSGSDATFLNLSAPFAGENGLTCDSSSSDPLCLVKGVLLYKPVSTSGASCSESDADIVFAGQATMVVRGLIWAPQSFIDYTGSGNLYMIGQALVGCVKFDGNGTLDITYTRNATYSPAPAISLDQ